MISITNKAAWEVFEECCLRTEDNPPLIVEIKYASIVRRLHYIGYANSEIDKKFNEWLAINKYELSRELQ